MIADNRLRSLSRIRVAGILVACCCALFACGVSAAPSPGAASDSGKHETSDEYATISMFMDVLEFVREKYVDADKAKFDKLIENAMRGMLAGLDPFSSYMPPKLYNMMERETAGKKYGGLGVYVGIKNGKQIVNAPIHDGPAFKAGIRPGDVILYVDDTAVSGLSEQEFVKMLKGPVDSKVKLTIYRPATRETKEITVTRSYITPSSVKWTMMPDHVGYIKISVFNRPLAEQLDKALVELSKGGMTALVLDLRNNPGGLLDAAVEVCSRFLDTGKLVVFIRGRNPGERKDYLARDRDKYTDIPIAILVNGNSASAAEVVSGCLKDYKRAVLIGERTFGKGSVQSIIRLRNGAALRLTTAKYYTPSEMVIHGHGIEPNIGVNVHPVIESKLFFQSMAYPGEIMPQGPRAVRDVQLERAVEILKGVRLFKRD